MDGPLSESPQGKPAEVVLRSWLNGQRQGATCNGDANRRLSDAVEGALQIADISGHYMGVYLRGLDIGVAEQFLEDADIDPVF